jgi:hypothetical protein
MPKCVPRDTEIRQGTSEQPYRSETLALDVQARRLEMLQTLLFYWQDESPTRCATRCCVRSGACKSRAGRVRLRRGLEVALDREPRNDNLERCR